MPINPKGLKMELYPYQEVGVEFFHNSNGKAILADVPGTGKTAQSLAYVLHAGFSRTLVICPASVKFAWEMEVKKWTSLKSFVVDPKTKLSDIPHDVQIVIINYDVLKKHFNELMKYKWDCMIVDEAHFCKSNKAIRSKIVKQLSKVIPHSLLLTGTPVLSRAIELFNLLNIIDPQVWNNWYQYAVRYAGGRHTYFGFEAKGSTNLEELKTRIGKYFLRRTKEEVLKELPPKIKIEVPVDLAKEYQDQYRMVSENLIRYLREHKHEQSKDIIRAMHAEKLVKLNLLREIIAAGSVDVAYEIISNIIDSGEKVLVFSCFNAPLKKLFLNFADKAVILLGETPVGDRGGIIKKFQEDPNCKIFFGGIKSAGTGITLTAASNVVILDLPFNPADLDQAINRAHRPGADYESLNIYQITVRNSISEFIKKMLDRKQEIIDVLIEGGEPEPDTTEAVDECIKFIEGIISKENHT